LPGSGLRGFPSCKDGGRGLKPLALSTVSLRVLSHRDSIRCASGYRIGEGIAQILIWLTLDPRRQMIMFHDLGEGPSTVSPESSLVQR